MLSALPSHKRNSPTQIVQKRSGRLIDWTQGLDRDRLEVVVGLKSDVFRLFAHTRAPACVQILLLCPAQGALSDDAVWHLSVWRLSRTYGRRPAGWMARVGWSGSARPAWLKAAAARFCGRPGRGHIVAAARLQLVIIRIIKSPDYRFSTIFTLSGTVCNCCKIKKYIYRYCYLISNVYVQWKRKISKYIYPVNQKNTGHPTLANNFAKCWPIFKILSLSDSAINV